MLEGGLRVPGRVGGPSGEEVDTGERVPTIHRHIEKRTRAWVVVDGSQQKTGAGNLLTHMKELNHQTKWNNFSNLLVQGEENETSRGKIKNATNRDKHVKKTRAL